VTKFTKNEIPEIVDYVLIHFRLYILNRYEDVNWQIITKCDIPEKEMNKLSEDKSKKEILDLLTK
jgi:hypothetical protein